MCSHCTSERRRSCCLQHDGSVPSPDGEAPRFASRGFAAMFRQPNEPTARRHRSAIPTSRLNSGTSWPSSAPTSSFQPRTCMCLRGSPSSPSWPACSGAGSMTARAGSSASRCRTCCWASGPIAHFAEGFAARPLAHSGEKAECFRPDRNGDQGPQSPEAFGAEAFSFICCHKASATGD
jgi:hypothetical protein